MPAEAVVVAAGEVDCGGHLAAGCQACPQGHGAAWCNGDCAWFGDPFGIAGMCALPGPFPGVVSLTGNQVADSYLYVTLFGFTAFLMLIFACVYKSLVVNRIGEIGRIHIASNRLNLFACFTSVETMLHTVFCMPVVMGKNYAAADIMGFWPGCMFSFFLTYTPLHLFGSIVRAILSMKVQARIGREDNIVLALLRSCCCLPCDVGRESMEVDAELGADITCCCNAHVNLKLVTEEENLKARMCHDGFGRNIYG